MTEQTTVLSPPTGVPVRCTGCGSTMAADQKYCLECGRRKGEPRVEFGNYMTDGVPDGDAPPPTPPVVGPVASANPADPRPVREITPLMAAGGLVAFAVILLLGVLVGRMGGTESQTPVVAATGLPTTAAVPEAGSSATTDVTVAFSSDWPSGKEGFTIELATVPKDSTDGAGVEATKADLTSQGAPEVGALDSDEFASLPVGNYVFYSGVYDTRAEATKALESLSGDFPEARVTEVSLEAAVAASGGGGGGGGSLITEDPDALDPDQAVQASKDDLESINEADASDFQELQQKLPPTIETPGKAPPVDNEAPGGGSQGVEIG